jgi:(1->4)-alpha-D-glucan 1-alpha-D-glucosylmutase
MWENSLVDPDNRRPFDPLAPGGAAELLDRLDSGWLPPVDETGAAKLLVTSRALRARRDRPDLFTGYRPVAASGPAAQHLVAFDRGGAVTLATRLPIGLARSGGWGDTTVELPAGPWTDLITGRALTAGPDPERPVTGSSDPGSGRSASTGAPSGEPVTGSSGDPDGTGTVRVAEVLDRYPVALLARPA